MYGGRRDHVDAHNSEAGWKSGVVARRMEVFERGEKGEHFCWWLVRNGRRGLVGWSAFSLPWRGIVVLGRER